MLSGEGLRPSSKGARVRFSGTKRTVIDGPFAEAKELVGGFWILETNTKEEVLEWVKKVPFDDGEIEVRQIAEAEDFAPAVETEAGAAALAAEAKFRANAQKK